jgi:hypothetical protein
MVIGRLINQATAGYRQPTAHFLRESLDELQAFSKYVGETAVYFFKMPRACPVGFHACCYNAYLSYSRCHGLVPWSFTLAAICPLSE